MPVVAAFLIAWMMIGFPISLPSRAPRLVRKRQGRRGGGARCVLFVAFSLLVLVVGGCSAQGLPLETGADMAPPAPSASVDLSPAPEPPDGGMCVADSQCTADASLVPPGAFGAGPFCDAGQCCTRWYEAMSGGRTRACVRCRAGDAPTCTPYT